MRTLFQTIIQLTKSTPSRQSAVEEDPAEVVEDEGAGPAKVEATVGVEVVVVVVVKVEVEAEAEAKVEPGVEAKATGLQALSRRARKEAYERRWNPVMSSRSCKLKLSVLSLMNKTTRKLSIWSNKRSLSTLKYMQPTSCCLKSSRHKVKKTRRILRCSALRTQTHESLMFGGKSQAPVSREWSRNLREP